jgi:hypothetical protein
VRQLIGYSRLLHGAFNLAVMILFTYHGWTGIRIRKERNAGAVTPSLIKKHRKAGPLFAALGLFGFMSGIIIVFIHFGVIVKYPPHLAVGSVLALCIVTTYGISRGIKIGLPEMRTMHFALGLCTLILYAAQIFLGLGLLF